MEDLSGGLSASQRRLFECSGEGRSRRHRHSPGRAGSLCPVVALLLRVRVDGRLKQATLAVQHPPPFFFLLFFPGNATIEKLEGFINNINSVLESLYIEIKKGVTEDDGRPILRW